MVTGVPPALTRLPNASFSVTVTVDVLAPSAAMLGGLVVIVDEFALGVPGVKATVA